MINKYKYSGSNSNIRVNLIFLFDSLGTCIYSGSIILGSLKSGIGEDSYFFYFLSTNFLPILQFLLLLAIQDPIQGRLVH